MRISSILLLIPLALFGVNPARACDVPVFRYALERWPADEYIACVFHDAPLTGEQARAVELLRAAAGRKEARPNLRVKLVDVTGGIPGEFRMLRESIAESTLPRIALRLPRSARYGGMVWSGDLNTENALLLIDSPLRRALVERIIAGDAAVWVLRECGNPALDRAAADSLSAVLEDLKRRPIMTRGRTADAGDKGHKAAFSMIRLPAGENGEPVFDAMLLQVEPDLESYTDEPMAIPVFGRGRALYALTGGGITAANIRKACLFMTGDCSCEVKDLNPGLDLLLAADWARGIGESWVDAAENPPLAGLPILPPASASPGANPAKVSADSSTDTSGITESLSTEPSPPDSGTGNPSLPDSFQRSKTPEHDDGSPGSFRSVWIAVAAAFLGIVLVVIVLTLRLGAAGRRS